MKNANTRVNFTTNWQGDIMIGEHNAISLLDGKGIKMIEDVIELGNFKDGTLSAGNYIEFY